VSGYGIGVLELLPMDCPSYLEGASMNRDVLGSGIGISIAFFFTRYLVSVMPKSVAWAGVVAGLLIVLADLMVLEMKLSGGAIALFLIGALCIGGAVHLSLRAKADSTDKKDPAPASTNNKIGDINGNKGIITQGQTGDNKMSK
jgi:hypothetical protein